MFFDGILSLKRRVEGRIPAEIFWSCFFFFFSRGIEAVWLINAICRLLGQRKQTEKAQGISLRLQASDAEQHSRRNSRTNNLVSQRCSSTPPAGKRMLTMVATLYLPVGLLPALFSQGVLHRPGPQRQRKSLQVCLCFGRCSC
jgi:hypothetical protein